MKKYALSFIILLIVGCSNQLENNKIPRELYINYQTSLKVENLSLIENSRIRNHEITHIVIHFISNVIANPRNPYIIQDIHNILKTYGGSAHYIIDRSGNIYLSVPESNVAYHAGNGVLEAFPRYENKLNDYSIGIELLGIGSEEEMAEFLSPPSYRQLNNELIGFTEEQYNSLNILIKDILNRHRGVIPNRKHIIGHDEYSLTRTDPGSLFDWNKLNFTRPIGIGC